MGWSDVSLCLTGPVVQDLRTHFTQRWNFIYDEKYSKKATRYERLPDTLSGAQQGGTDPPPQQRGFDGEDEGERGFRGDDEYDDQRGERGMFGGSGGFRQKIYSAVNEGYHQTYGHEGGGYQQQVSHAEHGSQGGRTDCQITRSSSKWSHNITTEVGRSSFDREGIIADQNSTPFKTRIVRL